MNKSIIIIVAILVLSCNSEKNKPKIEIVKQKSKIKLTPSENIVIEKSQVIIYNTLVFTENMKGELLNEKFKSAEIKLEFYKKFINPKKLMYLKR